MVRDKRLNAKDKKGGDFSNLRSSDPAIGFAFAGQPKAAVYLAVLTRRGNESLLSKRKALR